MSLLDAATEALAVAVQDRDEALLIIEQQDLVLMRLKKERDTMAETLTRAQERGTRELERARRAEKQRDDLLTEVARLRKVHLP